MSNAIDRMKLYIFSISLLIASSVCAEEFRVQLAVNGTTSQAAAFVKQLGTIPDVKLVTTNADYHMSVVILSDQDEYVASLAVERKQPKPDLAGHWVTGGALTNLSKGCATLVSEFNSHELTASREARRSAPDQR